MVSKAFCKLRIRSSISSQRLPLLFNTLSVVSLAACLLSALRAGCLARSCYLSLLLSAHVLVRVKEALIDHMLLG